MALMLLAPVHLLIKKLVAEKAQSESLPFSWSNVTVEVINTEAGIHTFINFY